MATEADILKALENLYGPGGVSLAGKVSGVMLSGAKAYVSLNGDPAKPEGWEGYNCPIKKTICKCGMRVFSYSVRSGAGLTH